VVTATAQVFVTEKVVLVPPGPVDSIALGPAVDDLVYLSVLWICHSVRLAKPKIDFLLGLR